MKGEVGKKAPAVFLQLSGKTRQDKGTFTSREQDTAENRGVMYADDKV